MSTRPILTTDAPGPVGDLRGLYIELLRKALTMTLWDAQDGSQSMPAGGGLKTKAKQLIRNLVGDEPAAAPDPMASRLEGRDWPRLAHTMIGVKRMQNLQFCVEDVIRRGVPGDLIETGVWRGGACIFMRGILKAYQVTDRTVWVADSFAGLPPPDEKYEADRGDTHHKLEALAVSMEQVKANFDHYGLLDGQVQFLKGWFKDTLPQAPIRQLAVARLDGDMYESTMDALRALYGRLSPGGYLIVDDYGVVPGCRQAVEDYRREHGITAPIEQIDQWGVYWRKNGQAAS